jgi:hypothetical protein
MRERPSETARGRATAQAPRADDASGDGPGSAEPASLAFDLLAPLVGFAWLAAVLTWALIGHLAP